MTGKPGGFAITAALAAALNATTHTQHLKACERAKQVGATDTEINWAADLWRRNRSCLACGHAKSSHEGHNCWMPACGCASWVPQEGTE